MFSLFTSHLLLSAQPSLWEELWEYIKDNWFTVDLGKYEHLSLGSGGIVTLRMVVLGLCIGFFVAAIASAFDRRKYGDFVRTLIREDCTSPEKAKTLDQLGYGRSMAIRSNLRSGHILRKFVRCVGEQAYWEKQAASPSAEKAPRYPMNFESDCFYIPKEDTYAAEVKFDKTGSGWRVFLLTFVLCILMAAAICFLIPEMLQLLDNFIGLVSR